MEKINNKVLMIIRGFIILFLFFNSVYFQYIPLLVFKTDVDSISGNMNIAVLLSTFSSLVMLLIILIVYRKDLISEWKIFTSNISKNIITGLVCWIVGFAIMIFVNFILIIFFKANGANNEIIVRSMIKASPILMGLDVCVFAPFIEEIVFRKTLKDVFSKVYIFVPLSFLLFGYAHVSSMATSLVDWLYIIPYGALGGVFAYAYSKTDTVFTSMTFHMVHNWMLFLLILLIV